MLLNSLPMSVLHHEGGGPSGEESRIGKMGRKMDHSLATGTLLALAILGCRRRCLFLSWIPFLVVYKVPTELSNRVLACEAQLCIQRPLVAHEFPCCMLPLVLSVIFPCHLCSPHTYMMTLGCLSVILKPMWVKSLADSHPRSSGVRPGHLLEQSEDPYASIFLY